MKSAKSNNNVAVDVNSTQTKKKLVAFQNQIPSKPETIPPLIPRARPARVNGHDHVSYCSYFITFFSRFVLTLTLLLCTGVYVYTVLSAAVNFCFTVNSATRSKTVEHSLIDFCHGLVLSNQGVIKPLISNHPLHFNNEPGITAVHANLSIGLSLPLILIGTFLALNLIWRTTPSKYQSALVLTIAAVVAIPHTWYAASAFVLPSSSSTRQLGALLALQYASLGIQGLIVCSRPRSRLGISHFSVYSGLALLGCLGLIQQVHDVYPVQCKHIQTNILQPIISHVDHILELVLDCLEQLGQHIKNVIKK